MLYGNKPVNLYGAVPGARPRFGSNLDGASSEEKARAEFLKTKLAEENMTPQDVGIMFGSIWIIAGSKELKERISALLERSADGEIPDLKVSVEAGRKNFQIGDTVIKVILN